MFIANRIELEKRFPAVSDEVFDNRIERLTKELWNQGYRKVENNDDPEIISFKRKEPPNLSYTFNLWQIRHEPDEDFDRIMEWIANQKGEK